MRVQSQLHRMLLQSVDRPNLVELLRVGDRVEAKVLRVTGETVLLSLAGERARVANTSDLQLVPGESLVLEMTSREGDVLIARPASVAPPAPSDQQVIEQLARTLDIPLNEESGRILQTMIRGGLPLTKEAFQSVKLGQFMTREIVDQLTRVLLPQASEGQGKSVMHKTADPHPVQGDLGGSASAAKVEQKPANEQAPQVQRAFDLPMKEVFRVLPALMNTLEAAEQPVTDRGETLETLVRMVDSGERLTEALVLLTKAGGDLTLKQLFLLDRTVFAGSPATRDLSALVRGLEQLLAQADVRPEILDALSNEKNEEQAVTRLLENLVRAATEKGHGEEAERLQTHLETYREKMDFLVRLQDQYHFVHVPLERRDAVLGMDLFVKKRGNRKDPDAPITLYIGLDTHFLDRVKVLFSYDKRYLDLTFKLATEGARLRVEGALDELERILEPLGLQDIRVQAVVEEEPSIKEAFFDMTPDAYATIDARV